MGQKNIILKWLITYKWLGLGIYFLRVYLLKSFGLLKFILKSLSGVKGALSLRDKTQVHA
jgi:hypothetical protein